MKNKHIAMCAKNERITNKKGFTLVELAIVLVIIGLIIGGVLVGRDLIRTAELRQVISDVEKYQAAVGTFRTKYNAIPGDMRNATQIWGAADADFTDCKTTQGTGTQTCNGNGDGVVQIISGLGDTYEQFRFWQHLANANLINAAVTGIANDGDGEAVSGVNVPSLSYWEDVGVSAGTLLGRLSGNAIYWDGVYTNFFVVGGAIAGTGLPAMVPVFPTVDAKWIDEKVDDGRPGQGNVMTAREDGGIADGCATTDVEATAEYDLTNTAVLGCQLFFLKKF